MLVEAHTCNRHTVTPALDAGVHTVLRQSTLLRLPVLRPLMDRRVKPGDDTTLWQRLSLGGTDYFRVASISSRVAMMQTATHSGSTK